MSIRNKIMASLLAVTTLMSTIGSPMTVLAEEVVVNDVHTHAYVEHVVAPTCETGGYTEYICDCGDVYREDGPGAIGHSYYAVETDKGTHRMVCRNDENHSYEEAHVWSFSNRVLPTCTDDGYVEYVCGECGAKKTEVTQADKSLGHSYTYHSDENGAHTGICDRNKNHQVTEYCSAFYKDIVTQPTCEEQGYTTHLCERCGYVLVDTYIPPLGHEYVYRDNGDDTHTGTCKADSSHVIREAHHMKETIVAPTCTTEGYTHVECKDCGYAYNDNYVPPVTHSWSYTSNDNGTHTAICDYDNAHHKTENCKYVTETVAPTCDSQGYELHTCKVCGYSYQDAYTKAKGHDYVYEYNDDGTHTRVCRNGGEIVTEDCDTIDKVVAPTCTTVGYTEHTCRTCGASYKDSYVDKLGHDYVWVTLNDGTHVGTCQNNERHTVREICNFEDIVTKPTCTANGYTTHKCTVCGYSYVDSQTPMLGHHHVYENLGDGTHRVTCKNDPYEINKIEDHTYTVKTVNPVCESAGYTLHTCELCGDNYKDNEIPAKGHNYVYTAHNNETHVGVCTNDPSHKVTVHHENVDTIVPATCETAGYTIHSCTVCGHVFQDSNVPAIGHKWVNVVTKPTCNKDGFTTHTCNVCGKVVVDSVVKSTGHQYTWVVDTPADIGIAGKKHQECVNCGHKKPAVTIAALKSTTRLLPIITSSKSTSQTLKWNAIPGAKYYKIYGVKCGGSYVELKKVTGTSWTRKGLKKKTYYKYIVKAFNRKSSCIESSASVHAATTGSSKKKNPTKITVKKSSISVKSKKSVALKASVSDKNVSRHTKRIRYISSNTSIATVNANGKVTGKKKGTCYIYVIAQNGIYKKVKVTIK